MFLSDILVPCIHLDSRLNKKIQELYCYEFYEIRSVFDASVYNLKSPTRFQSIRIPCLHPLNNTHPITHMHTLVMVK
jgi:hypothetical protein